MAGWPVASYHGASDCAPAYYIIVISHEVAATAFSTLPLRQFWRIWFVTIRQNERRTRQGIEVPEIIFAEILSIALAILLTACLVGGIMAMALDEIHARRRDRNIAMLIASATGDKMSQPRQPDMIFRSRCIPFAALEAMQSDRLEMWKAASPDPNSMQGRRRWRIALWLRETK